MAKFLLPICDYFRTRRKVWKKFIFPVLVSAIFLGLSFIIPLRDGVDIPAVFSDFINVQISVIAIFIAFSIAIISIMVSADNSNIKALKETLSQDGSIKPLNGKKLSLFQVLLSNLSYNVFVEVIYLIVLIVYLIIQAVLPTDAIRYLMTLGVFLLMHILNVLLECVVQMYLTFWKN